MKTEMLNKTNRGHARGWVLYDGECPMCTELARRFESVLARRGFGLAPLQTPWVQQRLRLCQEELLAEMKVLTPDGILRGGADAVVYLARAIWWAWPLWVFSKLPWAMPLLRRTYARIAEHRGCASGACERRTSKRAWLDWLPLVIFPMLTLLFVVLAATYLGLVVWHVWEH